MTTLILKNAHLIDGTGAPSKEAATVVIIDGKISEVHDDKPNIARFDPAELDKLEPHEREIVRKLFLEVEKTHSQQELAQELGVAQNQLRGMETRILKKLGVTGTGSEASAAESSQDTTVIDLAGSTLLPGLINAHFHIMFDAGPDPFTTLARQSTAESIIKAVNRAAAMLHAGITTARELGGYEWHELAIRDAIASGEIKGPRLLCAGKIITMTGGHGWPLGLESDGPDEVRKSTRLNLKKGADCIKMMATGGVLTPGVEPGAAQLSAAELRAGVEEAHNAGKRTASHAQGTTGIKNALRAGIDTIEHGIFLDDECIELMLKQGTVFVPTLAAPYRINEAGEAKGIPDYVLRKSRATEEAHKRSFQMALAAGVIISSGNDGGTPFNPSDDLIMEATLMVQYGMTPLQAIQATTQGSARALGIEAEVGTIEPGKWADLLILSPNANPLSDISALGQVEMVMQRGQVV